jgi:hypothetical protein
MKVAVNNRKRAAAAVALAGAGAAAAMFVATDGNGHHPAEGGAAAEVPRSLATRSGHARGFVRDTNGRPVFRARVRFSEGRRAARTNRAGRFDLRMPPGRDTLVASRRGYTRQSVTPTLRSNRGVRVDFSLAITAPRRVRPANSADRLILWTGCDEVVRLSDAALGRWTRRGVDGFVCQTGHLAGFGGVQRFTGSRTARLRGARYRLQRRLRSSPVVRRARAGELDLYLGFYTDSYYNERTPLSDWFAERQWSQKVIPRVRELTSAARSLGFAGVAIDQEPYTTSEMEAATWAWSYPGNRRSERTVREQVTQRGRQLMEAMVGAYPGLELIGYDVKLPESWAERIQAEVNGVHHAFASDVRVDLWDGLSSVQGYTAIFWMDAMFYKTAHDGTWDTALQYNLNRIYSLLSRRFSNWSYASARLHVSPFSQIDAGPTDFERARDPGYVAEQLEEFRRWGSGGAFANYDYAGLGDFDYGPYEDAMRKASTPGRVDRRAPDLSLTSPADNRRAAGRTLDLRGVASDNFAIRAVRWYDDRGREGVAKLSAPGGIPAAEWRLRWSIEDLHVPPGTTQITISAEDTKGLATLRTLTVTR